jgi:hypothetical protein
MKRIDLGKTMTLVANVGVIGGILLLAYELRQNNELMGAQARQVRTSMVIDLWKVAAENGELAELRGRERNGEELTDVELQRVDAYVMSVFVMIDWVFQELSANSPEMNQIRAVQRYSFANKSEYRRVWEDRKTSFRPEFVQWYEENVVNQ